MPEFDLVAIGGGAGAMAAVRSAATHGKRAAMITDGPIGGDCTWTGCVPSKTLIAAASQGSDFDQAIRRVHDAVRHIAATEDAAVFERDGIAVIEGHGRLTSATTIDVGGRSITGKHIVLATGGVPAIPPVPGLADIDHLTNETLWHLEERPERLGILGGGAIGCELAQAMARLGVAVSVFETEPRLLPREEPEASAIVRSALEADGVTVVVGQGVTAVRATGPNGAPVLVAGEREFEVDQVLVAVGRRPRTNGLGLETVGVELTDRGFVKVNRKLQTTVRNIWAVGDVNGLLPFTHAANEQGQLAAWAALGRRPRWTFDAGRVPYATFTTPEVARVGVVEADAPRGSMVAYLPMAENDRAITSGRTLGFVKLISAPRRILRNVGAGQIVGATIVAERAGEMIHEPAMSMLTGSFTGRLAQLSHAYPTWSFGVQKCAGQFFQPVEGRSARPAGSGEADQSS